MESYWLYIIDYITTAAKMQKRTLMEKKRRMTEQLARSLQNTVTVYGTDTEVDFLLLD